MKMKKNGWEEGLNKFVYVDPPLVRTGRSSDPTKVTVLMDNKGPFTPSVSNASAISLQIKCN